MLLLAIMTAFWRTDIFLAGTLVYNPPEVLKAATRHVGKSFLQTIVRAHLILSVFTFVTRSIFSTGYDSKPVDCWSLGIILYTLLLGHHPFETFSPIRQSNSLDSNSSRLQLSLDCDSDDLLDSMLGESCLEDIGGDQKDLNTCRNVLRLEGRLEVCEGRELGSGDAEGTPPAAGQGLRQCGLSKVARTSCWSWRIAHLQRYSTNENFYLLKSSSFTARTHARFQSFSKKEEKEKLSFHSLSLENFLSPSLYSNPFSLDRLVTQLVNHSGVRGFESVGMNYWRFIARSYSGSKVLLLEVAARGMGEDESACSFGVRL